MSEFIETDDEAELYIQTWAVGDFGDLRWEVREMYKRFRDQGYEPGVAVNMALWEWDI